ncbi:M14 family metallopeptidase [Sphingomonas hylomeconis]|uniref:M14 metallopeptidase family protein n=1 Tax=Sphingomonas hylomeconis TaxID=1395958 RepID=A0ABV7SWU2_9SPHN|nr:M14 metallopeptidase family protein [Sphingomonas hylomeconis]
MKLLPLAAALCLAPLAAQAQTAAISTPLQVLGHEMGEDRYVPSYSDLVRYWRTLEGQSDRIRLIDIGATTEGRRQIVAVVSSPENLARLDQYRTISERLGRAEGIDEAGARTLAADGKAVVWVDGGLHASEVEAQTALIQQVYDLVSSDDPEARRIRDNVITLFAPDNPDGQQLVADWYMRIKDPAKREADFQSLPKLYHPYVGHDNNRDFYMAEMAETQNITRILYREWRPQIILNQHQTGPAGTVLFMPPFRDPFNYHYEPLVISSLEELGATLESRLIAENKGGGTTRAGAHYDTWYNGNLRTSAYFHNAVGILIEIIGMPVPIEIPFVPERQIAKNDQPLPIRPQMWAMKQSVAYSLSINRALLGYAAANREKLLFNIWRMGANGIEKGQRDSWTITPDRLAAAHAASAATGAKPVPTRTTGTSAIASTFYDTVLLDPAARDARAYVIPAEQHDFPTAVRFLNALIKLGVQVERATAPFTANGKTWPAGSYVVRSGQAYRAHVLDMFEPQKYPNNFQYPGGPPIPPADASGYTPAFQMGVTFDRVLDRLDAPTAPVAGAITVDPGRIVGTGKAGWLVSHATNNAFILTNRLSKAGVKLAWLRDPVAVAGAPAAAGALWVPYSARAAAIMTRAVTELGLSAEAMEQAPTTARIALARPRVAMIDMYGGLHPTGWLRWILDSYEFPYTIVYPQRLDAGRLRRDFDVLIVPDSAIPNAGSGGEGGMFRGRFTIKQPDPASIPAQYRSWLGAITAERTLPALKAFTAEGGAILGMGSSTSGLIAGLGLTVTDPLAVMRDGKLQSLPRTEFYVPGALLTATADTAQPLAYGLTPKVDLFYDSSPVFKLTGATGTAPVRFVGTSLLHSGWAWHQEKLDGAAAVLDLPVGRGRVFLFGPEIALRAQTQGAFKLLFNAIYLGAAQAPARQ